MGDVRDILAGSIAPRWCQVLAGEFEKPYYRHIKDELAKSIERGAALAPKKDNIFRAFRVTDLDAVKVVILGQDPYPTPGHASGLAFGINEGCSVPRSLANIRNEVERDLLKQARMDGGANAVLVDCMLPLEDITLEGWANQGVLLLNTILTTEEGCVGAHRNIGWEKFTDQAIKAAADWSRPPTVFMLWGNDAQKKESLIRAWGRDKHVILKATHPSPLSYNKGPIGTRFLGCEHFFSTNTWLKTWGLTPIDWKQVK